VHVVVLQEVIVQTRKLAQRGFIPGGWILDVVALQPAQARCPGRQQNWLWSLLRSVPCDGVVRDTEFVVRLVQAHVDPSAVLLVPRLVGIAGASASSGGLAILW